MSARSYDVILTVDSVTNFESKNVVIGVTTGTTGVIANVDASTKTLKVKLNNVLQEFKSSETIRSNIITLSTSANGALNTTSLPFQANTMSGNTTTATATISAIAPSNFKAAKNAFAQNPIVRLYTVYYPGEWYPPNAAGNPTGQGEGRAWPNNFPLRFAEVVGDLTSDILYNVAYNSTSYIPFPVTMSTLAQGSEGKIDELTLDIFNVDNIITSVVEDPFLAGNNISNSVVATVNGEAVHGIDPRTLNANPADVGSAGDEAFDTLTRARANGLAYSASIEGVYGKANASFDRDQTLSVGGEWVEQKLDTRDLLGGVVEIKTTFANFLDYWPEYSKIESVRSNVIEVYNALPYRIGDNVFAQEGTIEATIQSIEDNALIYLSNELESNTSVGSALYIVNNEKDGESYIEDTFKIDQLEGLSDSVASFNLISWLQYFKLQTPKRKFYKNTCQWTYKGEECQYPGPGGLSIPGTSLTSNSNPIAANNQTASSASGDVCGKSIISCQIRNNQQHFGGFPATGRTVPIQ
jgi:phage-related protein